MSILTAKSKYIYNPIHFHTFVK